MLCYQVTSPTGVSTFYSEIGSCFSGCLELTMESTKSLNIISSCLSLLICWAYRPLLPDVDKRSSLTGNKYHFVTKYFSCRIIYLLPNHLSFFFSKIHNLLSLLYAWNMCVNVTAPTEHGIDDSEPKQYQ